MLPFRLDIMRFIYTGLVLALVASGAVAELITTEGPNAIRVWSDQEHSVRIQIPAGWRARAAVKAEEGVIVAGEDLASGDLVFLHQTEGVVRELPPLPPKSAALRANPLPVARAGRLEGAVWLEGTDHQDFSVRAATWNGTSWESIETIARGKAGQPKLAPAAAILEDGTWLAVWAGFDGADDEIFWSQRVDGVWSRARRLHGDNEVPDILPALTSQGAGAHVAWSTFDGNDYRIQTARWDGQTWTISKTLHGRGAVDAAFEQRGRRRFLTFRSIQPEGWMLAEFEPGGSAIQLRRTRGFGDPYGDRPLVFVDEDGRAFLGVPRQLGPFHR